MIDEFAHYLGPELPDATSGTSDFDDHKSEPDDCYSESADSNGITNAKLIAARIHEKVQKDSKPPTGNQNCQVCVWCAEAQFRGRTDMPRPVYSPRDPVLNILGESIVIHPRVFSMKSGFDDVLDILTEHPYARFYCHAKWKEGHGGHEFLIITENGKGYIMDPQQGTVDKFLETHSYIKDLKWEDSYLARMDDTEFNETVLRDFNTEESIVPWDAKLDIPYMLEHDMISKEEAEQYWKDHPDEASNDRHFLTFEELDRYGETKNKKTVELTKPASIFTSGDFAKYGKDVDLNKARGPIQEGFMMEFDHNSEKIPVKNINFDKVYFGSPKKYSKGIRTDRPLFVTPFIGIASIFIYGDLDIQNKVPRGSYNLEYEEWNTASDEEMNKPFKEVHVYVEGYPELEPYEIENTGYIHTVNVSKYKNDFYRYEWMSDKIEYLIDTDDSFVDVTSVQEVTVHYYVSGRASNNPKLGPYKKNNQTIQESTIKLPEGIWMRHATEEDLPNIIQWKIESVSEKIRDNPKTISFIKKDANDNLKDTKMIMSNDDVIGVLESCWIDNNEWWYIGEIYLIPAYRGKGIAKALLKLDIAGKDKVKLRVAKENKHAIDLYMSLGFKISEENDNSYIMIIDKTKPIQESQHCISYAMGVDSSIMKLKKDGFVINEDDGDYEVQFDSSKSSEWEKYISDHMKNTYWNEYINLDTHKIHFMIKDDGPVEHVINNGFEENPELLKTCNRLCEGDFKSIKELMLSNDFYKKYISSWDSNIQESWNDMKRGVNSRSKTLWFHVSRSDKHEGKVFTPRVPKYLDDTKFEKDDPYYEDTKIPRVCFSPSIEGAIHAITSQGDRIGTGGEEMYVYIPEKPIEEYKRITNKEIVDKKLVFDAKYTKECWITEPVKLILYGTIMIDQVYNHRAKPTANKLAKVGIVSYKWHWQTKPQVIKNTGHEVFAWNDDKEKQHQKNNKQNNKPVKEEFVMSDFARDPSLLKMILEAEADEEKEEKGDALDDDKDEDKGVETTEIDAEVEIGVDTGNVQNQYNPKEVEQLNKLINSEMSAVSEYFNAAKESNEPNLMRLFSDIGDEERFHLEQLIYAKSTITGEFYEPQDPKVKKEYQELLDMGMDEETAMTTAVDKVGLMPKDEDKEDMSDEEAEDFEEGFKMISMFSMQNEIMLEAAIDTSNIRDARCEETEKFLEQMVIMEDVYNLNTKEGQKALGTKSPIRMIWNAFKAIYNFIISLVKKAKLAFQKMRIKNREKWAWIKRHGIKGIFANGISLYFYNDRSGKYELGTAINYLRMIHIMNDKVVKAANIQGIDSSKYDIEKYISNLINSCKGSKTEMNIPNLSVPSIAKGMQDLNQTTLTKSKAIITDENEAMFEELFFGYTDQGFDVMIKEGENSKNIKLSFNVYNQLNYLLSAFEVVGNETSAVIEALANMEGKQDTVYSSNNKAYKECVTAMGVTEKALNKFMRAVSEDIKTCLDVDKGLKSAMQQADETGDKKTVTDYQDQQTKAKAESDQAKQAENNGTSGSNPTYYNK